MFLMSRSRVRAAHNSLTWWLVCWVLTFLSPYPVQGQMKVVSDLSAFPGIKMMPAEKVGMWHQGKFYTELCLNKTGSSNEQWDSFLRFMARVEKKDRELRKLANYNQDGPKSKLNK